MNSGGRTWYRRPAGVFLIALAAGLFLICTLFGILVFKDLRLMKEGKLDPERGAEQQLFQASLSRKFSNAAPTSDDLKRIEPTGRVPSLGDPKAKIRIVEFVDYGCPYCRQAAPVVRSYLAAHPNDVYLLIRDYPITELHPQAEDDAIAADCVFQQDEKKYWLYSDRLFASQEAQTADDLRLYAQQVGADLSRYDACVRSKTPLAAIKGSIDDGNAAGVGATPTFFFNGVKIEGAIPQDAFAQIVDQARISAGN